MNSELRQTVEKHLLDEAGVPFEKLEKIIVESIEHLRAAVSVLDEAIDNGDFEEIILSAHKLKGSLCNLGLKELSMVARNIEVAAASNVPSHLACYCLRLQRELRPFLEG